MDKEIFRKRCPDLFEKSRLTIGQVAERSNFEYHSARNYVLGKSNPRPNDERTAKLANALGTSVAYLFGRIDDPSPRVADVGAGTTAERQGLETSAPAQPLAEFQQELIRIAQGCSLHAASSRLAVRDVWLDGGLWPVQSDLGIVSPGGCIAMLHTVTFSSDYVDLGPLKDVAALRTNLLARQAATRTPECGILFVLLLGSRNSSKEKQAEHYGFFFQQVENLLARKIIAAGLIAFLSDTDGRPMVHFPQIDKTAAIEKFSAEIKQYLTSQLTRT